MKWFPFVLRRRLKAAIAQRDEALAQRYAALEQALRPPSDTPDVGRPTPIAVCRNRWEWEAFWSSDICALARQQDDEILSYHRSEEIWGIAGYSAPARRAVVFRIDMLAGGQRIGDENHPNLRESLVCPVTGLNNRQRLIASLVERELSKESETGFAVYCNEQVTPFYNWAVKTFPHFELIGSEFIGDGLIPGQMVDGVRHENLESLSFKDGSIGLAISNDVLEHVPSPPLAFGELARVMRSGATALMTFPFFPDRDHSVMRAEIIGREIKHICEPVYHGNPVSPDGSLVFTDFGWDLFDLVKECGFRDMSLEIYHSIPFGHLDLGIVFRLVR